MILLAESGSTKTDWRLIGSEVHAFETPGLNPYFVDSDFVLSELNPRLSIENKAAINHVFFYGTGITNAEKGEVVASGIRKALGREVEVKTYSDVVAAARALFKDGSGIAGILGTGSNSCFWENDQISFQIPPLGFWLGDEGSGGHLGKLLLLSYLHKEMPPDLLKIFEKQYGKLDRLEVLEHAYKKDKPNRYFASFCPFILENIDQTFCSDLAHAAFRTYFEKYILKYPMLREAKLGLVGSIAYHFQELIHDVAGSHGLRVFKTVQKPIDNLVSYHRSKL